MDDTYRLKIKIGSHEFEAEGPVQVVQAQFAAFKELVASLPPTPPPTSFTIPTPQGGQQVVMDGGNGLYTPPAQPKPDASALDSALDKIMKLENRVVSLTARPDTADSALLLLLYGQKVMRQNDAVTGMEVNDGIEATGGLAITRPDRVLERMAAMGDVIVIGERRSKTYRLTNAGLAKARQAASTLLATVA
jgi:hypothetical protein